MPQMSIIVEWSLFAGQSKSHRCFDEMGISFEDENFSQTFFYADFF
jgi:hypothetical protein